MRAQHCILSHCALLLPYYYTANRNKSTATAGSINEFNTIDNTTSVDKSPAHHAESSEHDSESPDLAQLMTLMNLLWHGTMTLTHSPALLCVPVTCRSTDLAGHFSKHLPAQQSWTKQRQATFQWPPSYIVTNVCHLVIFSPQN